MIRRNREHRELLRQCLDGLEVPLVDQDWPIVGQCDFRQVSEHAPEILHQLAEDVGEDVLIESGLAVLDSTGTLRITPRLSPGTGPMLALVDAAGAAPFDVLLPDGLLLGNEAPVEVLAHDYRLAALSRSSGRLMLIVPLMQDVMICHALGLAAVPVIGMEHLNLGQLRAIEELVRAQNQPLLPPASLPQAESAAGPAAEIPPGEIHAAEGSEIQEIHAGHPPEETTDGLPPDEGYDRIDLPSDSTPLELFISGWSFALQERIPDEQLQQVIAGLADVQRYLGIDFSGTAVWRPPQDDVARLNYCWQLGDRGAVVETVLESIRTASYNLFAAVAGGIAPWQTPATFLEARTALWRSLRSTGGNPEDLRMVTSLFEQLLEDQIINPLVDAAVNNSDPVMGALRIEFANVSALLQSPAPFLQYDLIQASTQVESRDRRESLDQSMRLHMQFIDRLVKLAQELRK